MKNFFETVKEFCAQHFKQVTFVVFVAIGTIFALLSNYATNQGYGNLFMPVNDSEHHRHTYHDERHDRNNSKRQPWTMQKPSSNRSSKNSNSSSHK